MQEADVKLDSVKQYSKKYRTGKRRTIIAYMDVRHVHPWQTDSSTELMQRRNKYTRMDD